MYIPIEISRFAVTELGELGILQFRDLNESVNAFQRTFAHDIRRLDEIERKLRYFKLEIEKENIITNEEIDEEFAYRSRGPQEIEEMEETISLYESRVKKFNYAFDELKQQWTELVIHSLTLSGISSIFERISQTRTVRYHQVSVPQPRFSREHVDNDVMLEDLSRSSRSDIPTYVYNDQTSEGDALLNVIPSNINTSSGSTHNISKSSGLNTDNNKAHYYAQILGHSDVSLEASQPARQRGNSIGSLDDLESSRLIDSELNHPSSRILLEDINIGFVAGVIGRERLATLEKVLWRSLRGNMYMEYTDLIIPDDDRIPGVDMEDMAAFAVFAHGETLQARITKISESFGATIYSISKNSEQRREDLIDILSRKDDVKVVLQHNKEAVRIELRSIAQKISTWSMVTRKEKGIFYAMNLFNYDEGRRCLIAEGWCPTRDLARINTALYAATAQTGSNTSAVVHELNTTLEPPTYIRTNKFTQGFQNIINSYGVPKYGEVNPGLFTTVSFPFLFAVMFGDLGHGVIMTMAALFLVLFERTLAKIRSEEFQMMFEGRYMILMMGIYSMVVGFVYNDTFSRAMHLFKPGWLWPSDRKLGELVSAKLVKGYVYPVGIDPTWHHSDNALLFLNSYKMKMSILLGVVHMVFGMCLQVFNARHFRKPINIKHVFLPQLIYFLSIFGYLSITIVYKWLVDWYAVDSNGNLINNSPPSLLNMLIYMFLSPGSVEPKDSLFAGQGFVQIVLLLVALVCVPWMLLAKPLILKAEHNKIISEGYGHLGQSVPERLSYESTDSLQQHLNTSIEIDNNDVGANRSASFGSYPELTNENQSFDDHDTQVPKDADFDFGEIMMNSIIHTIEFCLSGISHTASYLRLWALSLAHAQLSQVLWSMTLLSAFNGEDTFMKPLYIMFAFYMWFVLTVGILLVMEGLSAFLHALRLHWVEFNNKFYEGTGAMFVPFSFNQNDE
ncbi:hypothetical protein BB559_006131 [Furculomyces boomerangus]|uniref:V-type proton ATPase subunit a n=2 Tax=Harpellales TaxID=61421 RepID=A0A2T9Y4R9_9FUNG|nr:hypothetical protein BB559_006131 [Furculomyces boomerangus]